MPRLVTQRTWECPNHAHCGAWAYLKTYSCGCVRVDWQDRGSYDPARCAHNPEEEYGPNYPECENSGSRDVRQDQGPRLEYNEARGGDSSSSNSSSGDDALGIVAAPFFFIGAVWGLVAGYKAGGLIGAFVGFGLGGMAGALVGVAMAFALGLGLVVGFLYAVFWVFSHIFGSGTAEKVASPSVLVQRIPSAAQQLERGAARPRSVPLPNTVPLDDELASQLVGNWLGYDWHFENNVQVDDVRPSWEASIKHESGRYYLQLRMPQDDSRAMTLVGDVSDGMIHLESHLDLYLPTLELQKNDGSLIFTSQYLHLRLRRAKPVSEFEPSSTL